MPTSQYLVWDVDKVIFMLYEPIGIRWYSLFFLGGILLGNYFFGKILTIEHKPTHLRDVYLYYVVIGTIVGARLGHCLFYDPWEYFSDPIKIFQIWHGGLASHGGYAGVMIASYLFCRKYKEIPFFWLTDRVAIFAVMAGGFIRLGNFFNSEIIGRPTTVPWAVIFPQVDMLPRHPSQLYESLGYFSISAVLYWYYRSKHRHPKPGSVFGLAMIIAFTFRFFIEGLKENQVPAIEDAMVFNLGQLLSVPFVLAGIILFRYALTRKLA